MCSNPGGSMVIHTKDQRMVQMEKYINGLAVHGLPTGRENLQKSMGPTPAEPHKEGTGVQDSEARVARAMACDCNHQPMRRLTDIQRILKWTGGFNVRVRFHYEKQGQEDPGLEKAKEDEGMTKDARGGGGQAVPIPIMGDEEERRPRWAQYQFLRQLAWQKSRSLAPNLHMQRSEAYRAILKLLLMARDICRSYHTKTAAMDSIVEAVAKLDTVDWENFDADYDGYDGSARCGPVDEETAMKGLGKKGLCPIPEAIWRRCVPIGLLDDIENWEPNKSKIQPRPLSDVGAILCNTLVQEGFPERQFVPIQPNCSAFPKPKTKDKCSFILDMRNLI